jgi:hypothetical protein
VGKAFHSLILRLTFTWLWPWEMPSTCTGFFFEEETYVILEKQLLEFITEEAKKHSDRYHSYHNALQIETERKRNRVTNATKKVIKTPDTWLVNNLFNPFYVHKRRRQICEIYHNKDI